MEDEVELIHWLMREVKDAGHAVRHHGGGLGSHWLSHSIWLVVSHRYVAQLCLERKKQKPVLKSAQLSHL